MLASASATCLSTLAIRLSSSAMRASSPLLLAPLGVCVTCCDSQRRLSSSSRSCPVSSLRCAWNARHTAVGLCATCEPVTMVGDVGIPPAGACIGQCLWNDRGGALSPYVPRARQFHRPRTHSERCPEAARDGTSFPNGHVVRFPKPAARKVGTDQRQR